MIPKIAGEVIAIRLGGIAGLRFVEKTSTYLSSPPGASPRADSLRLPRVDIKGTAVAAPPHGRVDSSANYVPV